MPGATLATVAGTRSASAATHDHGGDQPSASKRRLPPDRRAGSTYAASHPEPSTSSVVTSPTWTSTQVGVPLRLARWPGRSPRSPRPARRPRPRSPASANASVSEPAPQPRSATDETP